MGIVKIEQYADGGSSNKCDLKTKQLRAHKRNEDQAYKQYKLTVMRLLSHSKCCAQGAAESREDSMLIFVLMFIRCYPVNLLVKMKLLMPIVI